MSVSTIQGGQSSAILGAQQVTEFFRDNESPDKLERIGDIVSQYLGCTHLLDVKASVIKEGSMFPNSEMIVLKIRNKPEEENLPAVGPFFRALHHCMPPLLIVHNESKMGTLENQEYERPTEEGIKREFETRMLERYANDGCRNPGSSEHKPISFKQAYNHKCEVTIKVAVEHCETGERGISVELNFLSGTEAEQARDVGEAFWLLNSLWGCVIKPVVSAFHTCVTSLFGLMRS